MIHSYRCSNLLAIAAGDTFVRWRCRQSPLGSRLASRVLALRPVTHLEQAMFNRRLLHSRRAQFALVLALRG